MTTRSISLCSTRKRAMKMRTSSGVVRLNFGTRCEPLRIIAEGVSSPLSLGTTVTECTRTDCAELSWATESKWNLTGDKPVKKTTRMAGRIQLDGVLKMDRFDPLKNLDDNAHTGIRVQKHFLCIWDLTHITCQKRA